MSDQYLLAQDTINQSDLNRLADWLREGPWLTQGSLVKEFQRQWSDWLGSEKSAYVNSGSSANLLMYAALQASGRMRNTNVIVPAVSWATTVAPAIQLGLNPLMCDAESRTLGIDPNQLEDMCKEHDPAAVIIVHVLGVPCDMDAIMALKDKYGFLLMEDACAATGSSYRNQKVGTFGELGSFSYFFGHHMSTIEGGMVSTSDEALFDKMMLLRSHGWAKDIDAEKEQAMASEHDVIEFNRPFTFYEAAFNLRGNDLGARLGQMQMERLDGVVERRTENHKVYQALFEADADFGCQSNAEASICSISFAGIAASQEHRERVGAALKQANIETRPLGGGNMSRQPFWTSRYGATDMPVADIVHERSFQLPNHPGLSSEDIRHIAGVALSVRP
jgi:CDP-4-dehydro-6-deoxyglucose reductase, E1